MAVTSSRTTSRGDARRTAIVAAAIDVFAERGPERATFAEIARRCGITPQAIYRYFATRDELYTSAILEDLAAVHVVVEERVRDVPFAFMTGAYQLALLEELHRHPLLTRVFAAGRRQDLELILASPGAAAHTEVMAREFAVAQRAGIVRRAADPEALARSVHAMAVFVLMPLSTDPEGLRRDWPMMEYVVVAGVFEDIPDLASVHERDAFAAELLERLGVVDRSEWPVGAR